MSRKPVHLEQAGGAVGAREAVWAAIRKHPNHFTLGDVPGQVNRATARDYLRCLEAGGYVARNGGGGRGALGHPAPVEYRLLKDQGVEAPRLTRDGKPVTQGRGREQMWRAMAAMASFDCRELAVFASTDDHRVALSEARDYAGALHQAGYLVARGRPARYRLVRRTGPKPPQVQRARQVWDANLHEITWREEVPHD